LGKKLH